jgi:hypothetical protein
MFVLIALLSLARVSLVTSQSFANCSGFSLASTNFSYMYGVYPNLNLSFTASRTQCQTIHSSAQLAILRDSKTLHWFYNDWTSRVGSFAVSGKVYPAWIGLYQFDKLAEPNGDWVWVDGVVCNKSDPNDVRCYAPGEYAFDNFQGVQDCASTNNKHPQIDDITCNYAAPFYCEIPVSACLDCPPGTALNQSTSLCSICPPGSYSNQSSNINCLECPPGNVPSSLGTSCVSCDVGSFRSNTSFATDCALCPIAKFQNETGASFCYDCPGNKGSSFTGLTSESKCISCKPGFVQSAQGCVACPWKLF